jgi:branched-chain amino acid transport system permease protein
MLVAILLAGIVLFRPQGLLPEDKVVSRFLGRITNPQRKQHSQV